MRIAIIGGGNVGGTLARSLSAAGETVVVGVRHPEDADAAALGGDVVTPDQAVDGADVVILAMPAAGAGEFLSANGSALDGVAVIDATNDVSGGDDGSTFSVLGRLAEAVPGAAGYRAFNPVGWENMAEPRFGDEVADMFYAGPDGPLRERVEQTIAAVGFRPVYVGDDPQAHHAVDALLLLWFSLVRGQGRGRRLAFRMLGG